MQTLRVMVVDDEQPAREEMIWLLEQCDALELQAQAPTAQEAVEALEEHREAVDLVLLDVDMPGIDGLRLAERWHDHAAEGQRVPLVIFVTAHEDYAVEAFAVDAVDYLLKPVRLERLKKALQRARERHQARLTQRSEQQDAPADEEELEETLGEPISGATGEANGRRLERISVHDKGVYRVLPLDDVLFFESEDGVVVVEARQGRFITDFSLKFLEQNLNPDRFFRSHRSAIVRIDAIEAIVPWGAGTYRLIVDDDSDRSVPLARSRAAELKSLIPWSANMLDEG